MKIKLSLSKTLVADYVRTPQRAYYPVSVGVDNVRAKSLRDPTGGVNFTTDTVYTPDGATDSNGAFRPRMRDK